jgi:rhamnosyltransferase
VTEPAEKSAIPAAIILYNPVEQELENLLGAISRKKRHIFIAINSALSAELEKILQGLPHATLLRFEENIGQGAALNQVMRAADLQGYTHLVLFDQDSTPTPCMIEKLKKQMEERERQGDRIAALGPCLVTPETGNYRSLTYIWLDREKGIAPFIPTSGSLINLEIWKRIGPFREDYFIGGIDVEWGFRARKQGFSSIVTLDIPMVHRWGTASEDGQKWLPQILRQSDLRNYFYLRNMVDMLTLPHIPKPWKIRSLMVMLAQILALLASPVMTGTRRQWVFRALQDGWRGRLGPLPGEIATGQ